MLILAVAVVAVRAGSPDTVEAATGDISVLNVGTCYTTNTDAFGVGDCDDGDGNAADTDAEGYDVAGRDSISEADSVFATYAIDPKTSGDRPRAILKNADLIKISIEDKGRDKRTGKIYSVGASVPAQADTLLAAGLTPAIQGAVGDEMFMLISEDDDNDPLTPRRVRLNGPAAYFERLQGNGQTLGNITTSGDAQFQLTGDDSTDHPMAPDGDVYWFGIERDTVTSTDEPFASFGEFIERDEDFSPGVEASIAPWMRVTAALPANVDLNIQYIYYETSEYEEIVGGDKKSDYMDVNGKDVSPVFFDDENAEAADKQDALVLRVSSDGNTPTQNLHLKEKSDDRFSGIYEGYVRLTDADGDGSAVDDPGTERDEAESKDNWGLANRDAEGAGEKQYAVIGVESGPITITYKNSKGDTRSLSITVDKDAPTIQVDSPIDGTASTDDSPELIGTFADGGGSGLRESSFKIYADNTPDSNDDSTPVWELGVLDAPGAHGTSTYDRGQVCVDAKNADDEDVADGDCDAANASAASLRSQYFGYEDGAGTYGIVYSNEIYLNPKDDLNLDEEDDYKTADAEEFEDGDTSGEFDTIVRIDFPPGDDDDERYNHVIDIQAVVLDVAGNIGFSDSDPSGPTFIHDLGTAYKDRTDKGTKIKHNVIGVYSRHTYILDDVDPYYKEDQSATGFFIDADGDESINNSGVMVVFDGPLDPATVGIGTFTVALDGGSDATVVDAAVDSKKVYLLLEEELAPDSTPSVDLASGQSVADLAGNESTDRRLDGIELNDGILPTFTVTLSGGTGLNDDIDGEGPSELTKAGMKISIAANETIQGAPQFAVVCSGLFWDNDDENTSPAKYASERTGAYTSSHINKDAAPNEITHNTEPDPGADDERTMCPDGDSSRYSDVARTNAHRRAGNNWEYDWSTLSDDSTDPAFLADGTLNVIVWGRDRSSYMRDTDRVLNYSASTVNFDYDTDLMAAWKMAANSYRPKTKMSLKCDRSSCSTSVPKARPSMSRPSRSMVPTTLPNCRRSKTTSSYGGPSLWLSAPTRSTSRPTTPPTTKTTKPTASRSRNGLRSFSTCSQVGTRSRSPRTQSTVHCTQCSPTPLSTRSSAGT